MTEPLLRDYFLGIIPASKLEEWVPRDGKVRAYYKMVEAIEDDEFEIFVAHLISICDDIINGEMKLGMLEELSFILIGSDYFFWDTETVQGEKIETVIIEWDNPDMYYPLTVNNVFQWRRFLAEGKREMETHQKEDKKNI